MIRKPKNQFFLWWFICFLLFIVNDRKIHAETLKLTLRNSNEKRKRLRVRFDFNPIPRAESPCSTRCSRGRGPGLSLLHRLGSGYGLFGWACGGDYLVQDSPRASPRLARLECVCPRHVQGFRTIECGRGVAP